MRGRRVTSGPCWPRVPNGSYGMMQKIDELKRPDASEVRRIYRSHMEKMSGNAAPECAAQVSAVSWPDDPSLPSAIIAGTRD
ncbi:hypothetical protein CHELA40_40183 [Chelatococcus asaccharovorans]|nr:hypothetical protein CHELA17_50011 [Chelatococcus asaccharovorans]CAH1690187.1 hypothetical protein CHELA40_40183 [Chelatococcus asaccharovorans]